MQQSRRDVELGRFLSLVLRHNPAAAYIQLDANGWADVEELLRGMNRAGKSINREALERIVRENNKQRYSFNEDKTKIRANQGHSVSVDVELEEKEPPARLYHGTASRFLEEIRKNGISSRSRQYVHLSHEIGTARNVGSRHGKPVILPIDAAAMYAEGHGFYLSQNGVWLCKFIPWKYVLEQELQY